MLDRLCLALKEFYDNPNNKRAYEAWKKEISNNESDHSNRGLDAGKP